MKLVAIFCAGVAFAEDVVRFQVPERHAEPNGPKITLAYVRWKSTSSKPGPPIVYLAGGPGGSGIALSKGPRGVLFSALRAAGDVIALDQRGTGLSEPNLNCPGRLGFPLDAPADFKPLRKRVEEASRSCANYWRQRGVHLDAYNVVESAHDLDDLRKALGAKQLALWGSSYGTHLGLSYLRHHGEHVSRAVLSGIEGPDQTLKLPSIVDSQLRSVGAWALAARVLTTAEKKPFRIPAPHAVTLGRFDIEQQIAGMTGTRAGLERLPRFLRALDKGDLDAPVVQDVAAETIEVRTGSIGSAMAYAMDCSSGASKSRLAAIDRSARTAFIAHLDFPVPEVCSAWGVPELPASERTLVRSPVAVLFLSGTADGRTPPPNAEEVRQGFPNSHHVLIEGAGHGNELFVSSPEIEKVTLQFFLNGTVNVSRFEIRDVTAIDPKNGTVKPHQTVTVDNGRPRSPGSLFQLIDGTGKYLIPGLWDAHVHLTKAGELSLPLFVANGVTGVRDMGSDLAEIRKWQNEIKAGDRIGPQIKTSGQILESRANVERMKKEGTVEPVDRIRIGVANPSEARAAVAKLAAAGVDHIKMRTAPDIETFRAAADEAKRHDLRFAAHAVGTPEQMIEAGVGSVEHVLAYPPLNGIPEEKRRALFRRMRDSGMYFSDTVANLPSLISTPYAKGKEIVEDKTGSLDPRRKYLCGYLIEDWREQLEENTEDPYGPLRKELPNLYRDLREMREEGVPFLAGTDVGVLFMYPGWSLHDELYFMVRDLGFTPMETLRIATSGVPGFYGIKPSGDRVLLRANPLEDIRNTKEIEGVLIQGRWLDRKKLDSILATVAEKAKSSCAGAIN